MSIHPLTKDQCQLIDLYVSEDKVNACKRSIAFIHASPVCAVFRTVQRALQCRIPEEYIRWKAKIIAAKILPIFKSLLEDSHILVDMRCPITHKIALIPMRSIDGKVYELDAIADDCDPTVYRYDWSYHINVVSQLKYILNQKIENASTTGSLNLDSLSLEERAQFLSVETGAIAKKFILDEMSNQAFDESLKTTLGKFQLS